MPSYLIYILQTFTHYLILPVFSPPASDPPRPVDEESIVVQPSLTSITLTWVAAKPFPGYPVTGYTVELQGVMSGNTVFTGTTNTTSITIQGLYANQEYNLAIVTVSGSGDSVPVNKAVMTSSLGEHGCMHAYKYTRMCMYSGTSL